MFVPGDAEELRELVGLAGAGVLALEVTRRASLDGLLAVHAEAAEGWGGQGDRDSAYVIHSRPSDDQPS